MKNLSETIKKIPKSQLNELIKILEIKETAKSPAAVCSRLLSYSGIALIISHLNREERNILRSAYSEKDGITFDELSKRLKLDTEIIEKYANNLSNKLIITVLKNRQKLSNKLDKVYINQEIRNFLNPIYNEIINNHFKSIYSAFENSKDTKLKNYTQINVKHQQFKLFEHIFNSGGIILLEEFFNYLSQNKNPEKILSALIKDKFIILFNDLNKSGKTFLVLDKKLFIELAMYQSKNLKSGVNVNNGFSLLINLLKVYDTVSTFGLFLTKQKVFRKIDKKHLEDSMIRMNNADGTELSRAHTAQLSLYLLNVQDCVEQVNDSIVISVKNISDFLDEPFEWLMRIFKLLDESLQSESLIKVPIEIPSYKELLIIIELIHNIKSNCAEYIEAVYFSKVFSHFDSDQFFDINKTRQNIKKQFQLCIKVLCIFGIIKSEKSRIELSDIGKKIIDKENLSDLTEKNTQDEIKNTKNVYLNSDFTLITPKKELTSEALYHILTHTEIIKDDILLQTRISRESILTSLKRGMTNDKFFYTLKNNLKTEIPGNLNFLISEWLNQSIKVKIFNAAILETNPSFMDKISHSKIKNCIIKRISDQYAILDMRYFDKLIKMSKENDAIIKLFDESEESG